MVRESPGFCTEFPIGELARRTGCSIDTIRYYERIDLMPEVRRTEGGHRLYDRDHIGRLAFIRRSRRLGLSLAQVRGILDGVERSACRCAEVKALLTRRAEEVRTQIEALQKIERNLRRAIETCGDARLANCHVIKAMLSGEDFAVAPRCCSERESSLPR
ncbi:MerR family transcriptional regulator [Ensifer sp. LCM 4579]|uniref:MerR family transcriptional regulator n=1 Tax=Ensifer sp. LCM 4579 TaxID=1848292 RepID=UPI0008DACC91|nr:MerR family transcriptional regulator [Ensifer sp. LCM 4579]OHV79595.1 hypothetical protein LCM4579_03305 [Ensifer sp. LCM 4579]